ncbi:phospholipase C [Filimonas lacunae]|uniref:phospholipase C n=1 Tax=Filimonas lacunae TaxID=477680 RepID=A0A173MK60_9BACT|nr:phospholipase C, phosphocholine-specific [Filimonas lacunae]BAV07788.1 non-hemolytic phospholipase C [Filimonas lacunae]SIT04786.1 phospholipase C [Filimonas lacunae]
MDNRREFLKKAALLSGSAALAGLLPASIQKALAIEPDKGSTWLDAEHVVILMQENRSFDHCFGALQGVRGFNDPRAIQLPNDQPVWMQSNKKGDTYAPFRLNIHDTKATWMHSLPHSWDNQVNARNNGKYDGWLEAKRSGTRQYKEMPLTLGYHTREDLPFYYALADAFTVCDQHFCSSLTGTTPNRLYLWSGTIREKLKESSKACVLNQDADFGTLQWHTFPELLQKHDVSWKVYQNELSVDTGFKGEEEDWLANYTDNPLEFFAQYHVHMHPPHLKTLHKERSAQLSAQWEALSPLAKDLHRKAFTTNAADPNYRQLTGLTYDDAGEKRGLNIPKGDILHQFRQDVGSNTLPTVSWLVAPQKFSDHPSAPWYGAWYVSEVMDILTQNPEVWKKTIFIVTYDENDGYFDHVPPFVPPHPHKEGTGKVSGGIDVAADYVTKEQAAEVRKEEEGVGTESPIGLGYRVPLIIASPWSRGGWVNSQVCDHTSSLQMLEQFLSHKTGKKIRENNISEWRRTVCGNLSSVFRAYNGEPIATPQPVAKEAFLESIHQAQFKPLPGFEKNPATFVSPQEKGIRPACALPYELYADGGLAGDKKEVKLRLAAGDKLFGKQAAGSPFTVYAPGNYLAAAQTGVTPVFEKVRVWSYAAGAGDEVEDTWPLSAFEKEQYHLRVYAPNGFYREFKGNATDPAIQVECRYKAPGAQLELHIHNHGKEAQSFRLLHHAYQTNNKVLILQPHEHTTLLIKSDQSHGWYDFSVYVDGFAAFEKRYAGRIETGAASFTDPLMGGVI